MASDTESNGAGSGPLAQIFSDQPVISRNDTEADRNLAFEFSGLARTLAELAQNPKNRTPFTVVVRGGWGRGKTTLLKETQRQLECAKKETEIRQVRTLWFNAWKYPDEETVLAGLLGALLDKLDTGDLLTQLKVFVNERKGRLATILIKLAAPWLDVDGLIKPDSRFSKAEEKRAYYDAFRPLFAELWYLWQNSTVAGRDTEHIDVERRLRDNEQHHALAIFLDDLDRCPDKRVLDVLHAINLFLDLPGVCFFLGVDWNRLSEILEESMPGRQDAFLEKIVQVSLELPEVSDAGALEYVKSLIPEPSLAEMLPLRDPADLEALVASLQSRHPRHIKGMLNDLSMTLAILRNTNRLGTGPGMLPERAILAWNMLREILPPSEWAELRARRVNLEGFLRKWQALEEGGQESQVPEGFSENLVRLHRSGLVASQLEALVKLGAEQRDVLVHFGSPPAVERAVKARDRLETKPEIPGGAAWVDLPGDQFQMGSEDIEGSNPVHRVKVSPFKIARYPITNAVYKLYVSDTGTARPDHWLDGEIPNGLENHPVVNVTWKDAVAYSAWLSRQIPSSDGGVVRLPSEAEWEYAARGVEDRAYPWGKEPPSGDRANYGDPSAGTSPVGSFPKGATPEGVHDLAGNVWEWCADWYGEYGDSDEKDPIGPASGNRRVLRGGSFHGGAGYLRAAYRNYFPPERATERVGFRVVWSPSGGQD